MPAFFGNYLLPGLGMYLYRYLVAHAARRNPQCGFLFRYLGRAILQTISSRIVAKNIVSNFSRRHCGPHFV